MLLGIKDPFADKERTPWKRLDQQEKSEVNPPTEQEVTDSFSRVGSLNQFIQLINEWQDRGWPGLQGSTKLYTPAELINQISNLVDQLIPNDISKRPPANPNYFLNLPILNLVTRAGGLRDVATKILVYETKGRRGILKR